MASTDIIPASGKLDVAKALKYRLQGLSYAEIGELMGFGHSSIHEALQKFSKMIERPDLIQSYRENEAELLDSVRMELISTLPDDIRRKGKGALSGYQKVGMYGILFDKMRLLKSESTVNLNSLSVLIVGAAKDFAKGKTAPVDVTDSDIEGSSVAVDARREDDPTSDKI